MTTARITVFGVGSCPTGVDMVELPDVELVRSSHIVDVYRSGEIGWSQFRNSDRPYNQIDTHINALIAIRDRVRGDEKIKEQAEAEARRVAEKVRDARVAEILKEAGVTSYLRNSPVQTLAEKIFEMEQEKQKK